MQDNEFISRQVAIDALNEVSEHYTEKGREWHPHVSFMIDAIKELPSAQQWIPVTERLPEEDGKYLVCGSGKIWICKFMFLDGVHGWCNDAWNPRVEAWTPLPEPYREETGERMQE